MVKINNAFFANLPVRNLLEDSPHMDWLLDIYTSYVHACIFSLFIL